MAEGWYTRGARARSEKGPFETSVVLQALARGDLQPSTLVRAAHEQTWTTLREHPSFRPQPSPPNSEPQAADSAAERAIALYTGKPEPVPATLPWWIGAALGFGALVVVRLAQLPPGRDGAYRLGTVVGTFLSVMIVVGIASIWRANRTQYGRVKWFCIGCGLMLALNVAAGFAVYTVAKTSRHLR